MHNQNCTSWPEVELPQGWKRNPHVGQRLNWILLLTVIVAGGVTLLSAGKSEVLPAVCFLALVALPIAGPALARIGCGTNSREARELHTLTPEDARLDEAGCLVRYRGPYQKLHIPDEVAGREIASAAPALFAGNRILAYVHLPQGLTEIPEHMFRGCDNLPAIVIPPCVRRIGVKAFAGCTELKDVYLPDDLEEIGANAFEDCGYVLMHVHPGTRAETLARELGFLCANK